MALIDADAEPHRACEGEVDLSRVGGGPAIPDRAEGGGVAVGRFTWFSGGEGKGLVAESDERTGEGKSVGVSVVGRRLQRADNDSALTERRRKCGEQEGED